MKIFQRGICKKANLISSVEFSLSLPIYTLIVTGNGRANALRRALGYFRLKLELQIKCEIPDKKSVTHFSQKIWNKALTCEVLRFARVSFLPERDS